MKLSLLFIVSFLSVFQGAYAAESKMKNVIIVSFDALRADHLGIYGYEKPTSPNLDAFAKTSVVFRQSFSQCGSTPGSMASLLTSKFPNVDGILAKGLRLKATETTLPEILSAGNFATGAVSANFFFGAATGTDRGFNYFDPDPGQSLDTSAREAAAATLERALRMLEKLSHRSEDSRGFLFWVHFRQPHYPYDPDYETFKKFYPEWDKHRNIYADRDAYNRDLFKIYSPAGFEAGTGLEHGMPASRLTAQSIAAYDGNIWEADKAFGVLWNYLQQKALSENSMVIVTADHGESLGEQRIFGHNALYYSILHTPLIIYSPNRKHRIVNAPVGNIDIFPTVLSALDIDDEKCCTGIRGINLFDPDFSRQYVFAEDDNKAVIAFNHLYIFDPAKTGSGKMYNLREDPTRDVLAENQELAKRLQAIFEREILKGGQIAPDETVRRLRELGYL